jgi:DNA (cytosine-5)-methyltransferase 1
MLIERVQSHCKSIGQLRFSHCKSLADAEITRESVGMLDARQDVGQDAGSAIEKDVRPRNVPYTKAVGSSHSIGIIDLFCGTSGFSTGFTKLHPNYELVGAVDLNVDAASTAKQNHPDAFVLNGDLLQVSPRQFGKMLPSADVGLIVGGPPCQGFSSLRPFRSSDYDDPRNSLFEQFASFVSYFRPRVFVLENVVGILTHKDGGTVNALTECFSDLGYACDWRILNAANYGVPQKRERFVLIGSNTGASPSFPEPTHSFQGRVIGYRDRSRMVYTADELPAAVTVAEAFGDLPPVARGQSATDYILPPLNDYQSARRASASKLTLHEAPKHSDKILEIIRHSGQSISSIPRHLITSGFSSSYSRLDGDKPANTMTVKFQSAASSRCIHPTQDRALTLREGARLQSFDDDFVFAGSATSVASQIGNAVPPLLGAAIAESVSRLM